MTLPLALRFAPKKTSDIPGREAIIKQLHTFVTKFTDAKKQAILLTGPSGTGKTSLVTALAHELNAELFELNASDKRNKGSLEEVLLPVMTTRSFFSATKIILLDEIDGVSGKDDRGGVQAISKLLAQSQYPVIMTANDGYSDKLKSLRKVVTVVDVGPLETKYLVTILERICEQEKFTCDAGVLDMIARKNVGDIRGALNDLEVLAVNKTVTRNNVLELDERIKKQSIQQALTLIFKSTDITVARTAFDAVDEDLDQLFMWLDYNTAKEYTGVLDRARAYSILSRVDVFRGRIRRRQDWRFLVYIKELLTAGIAVSKQTPYKKPPSYKQSSRPLRIWMLNNQVAKKKAIAQKIADYTHRSTRQVLNDFAYYGRLCLDPRIQQQLEIDDDQIQWLQKTLPKTASS